MLHALYEKIRLLYVEFVNNGILFLLRLARNAVLSALGRNPLQRYRNLYRGRRCFLVGTGPSLKIEDLDRLKGEICFSANTILLSFPQTDWRPDFYGIIDKVAYWSIQDKIDPRDYRQIFYGADFRNPPQGLPVLMCYWNHIKDCFPQLFLQSVKFSGRPDLAAYDGNTVLYMLLQMAVYMGFSEIYLLGVDCNYQLNQNNHFIAHSTGVPEKPQAGLMMQRGFAVAKAYADAHGVGIFNATRGGMLEVFPRVSLEEVLSC